MAYAYANQGILMHDLSDIEGREIRLVEFGPYKMTKAGTLCNNNGFRAVVSGMCWDALAEACKIPKGFLKDIPPELRAININYRLSQMSVRHKYGLVVRGGEVIGLLPKNYEICSNSKLLEILTSVYQGKQRFIDWYLGLRETYLYMVFPRESFPYKGPEHICLGMAVAHSAITSSDTMLHRLLYDTRKNLIVLHPMGRRMDPISYKISVESMYEAIVFDAESIIEDYKEACEFVVKDIRKFVQHLGEEVGVGKSIQRDVRKHVLKCGGLHFLIDFVRYVSLLGEKSVDKPGQKFTYRTMGGRILTTGRSVIDRLSYGS